MNNLYILLGPRTVPYSLCYYMLPFYQEGKSECQTTYSVSLYLFKLHDNYNQSYLVLRQCTYHPLYLTNSVPLLYTFPSLYFYTFLVMFLIFLLLQHTDLYFILDFIPFCILTYKKRPPSKLYEVRSQKSKSFVLSNPPVPSTQ